MRLLHVRCEASTDAEALTLSQYEKVCACMRGSAARLPEEMTSPELELLFWAKIAGRAAAFAVGSLEEELHAVMTKSALVGEGSGCVKSA